MADSVRYCIRCGRQIGESPFCTNPECGKIPNFYRLVPSPSLADSPIPPGRRRRRERPSAHHTASTRPLQEGQAETRHTMPLQAAPIAVLDAVAPEGPQHVVFPGVLEVGARPPADIIIDCPQVSSRHARIVSQEVSGKDWQVMVIDRGSTNGTYVNDKRVDRSMLEEGDHVRFANVEYVIRFVARDEPRVTMMLD